MHYRYELSLLNAEPSSAQRHTRPQHWSQWQASCQVSCSDTQILKPQLAARLYDQRFMRRRRKRPLMRASMPATTTCARISGSMRLKRVVGVTPT